MQVELKPDYAVTDDVCQEATGRTLTDWMAALDGRPEFAGKRREALRWLYEEMNTTNVWWPTTVWVEWEKTRGTLQRDGRPEGYNICATKVIAAPIPVIFSAWTNGRFADWFGDGPKTSGDGSFEDAVGNRATASRIREDKDLRYRWRTAGGPDETEIEVMFADNGKGKTLVTLYHKRIQTRDEADGLRRAWGVAFDRLKTALEG